MSLSIQRPVRALLVLCAVVVASAGRADAQLFDHLQCLKIKDATAKKAYNADIVPADPAFAALAPGCVIRVPAHFLCIDVRKTNVNPTPPGAPDGVPLQKYLCYKAKCDKNQPTATLTDQFGSHAITVKGTSFVCAPVAIPPSTTTTTVPACIDTDLDGFCAGPDDCNDSNPNIYVGAAEVCDGLDNNCDGAVDEGDPGGGVVCNTGNLGVCAAGTTHCSAGGLVCTQNVPPSAETCDGLDNNCDGAVDEGNPGGGAACSTGLPGQCAAGTTACLAGAIVCSANQQPSAETCDGLDNNCDGAVDEGNPGGGAACSTGLPGQCAAGTTACVAGAIVCSANVQPSAETCDGLDNNCDGTVDEGNPGGGAACSTGLPGRCAAGTTACLAGAIVCSANQQPSAETCNGLDDDCDGTVDNGDPGGGVVCNTGLIGVCAAGTTHCFAGALVCTQNVQPSAETCGDGLDNDCNGVVDNGCPP